MCCARAPDSPWRCFTWSPREEEEEEDDEPWTDAARKRPSTSQSPGESRPSIERHRAKRQIIPALSLANDCAAGSRMRHNCHPCHLGARLRRRITALTLTTWSSRKQCPHSDRHHPVRILFSSQFHKLICAVQGHQTRHGDASLRRHERKRRRRTTRTSTGNSWSLLMYNNLLRRTWQPGSRHIKVLFACAWHECDADVDNFCRGNAAEAFHTKSASSRYVLPCWCMMCNTVRPQHAMGASNPWHSTPAGM